MATRPVFQCFARKIYLSPFPFPRTAFLKQETALSHLPFIQGGEIHETPKGFSSFIYGLLVLCPGMPARGDDSGRGANRRAHDTGMQLSGLCPRDRSYLAEIRRCAEVYGR